MFLHNIKEKSRLYITAPRNYLLKQTIKTNKYDEQLEKNDDKLNLKKRWIFAKYIVKYKLNERLASIKVKFTNFNAGGEQLPGM